VRLLAVEIFWNHNADAPPSRQTKAGETAASPADLFKRKLH
jgi:hypothetical protein